MLRLPRLALVSRMSLIFTRYITAAAGAEKDPWLTLFNTKSLINSRLLEISNDRQ